MKRPPLVIRILGIICFAFGLIDLVSGSIAKGAVWLVLGFGLSGWYHWHNMRWEQASGGK